MYGAYGFIGNSLLARPCKAGNTEVRHFNGSVRKKHNVLGLYIPVNNALVVGVLKRPQNLYGKMHRLFPAEHLLLFDILFKGYSVDVLHNDILNILVKAYVVNLYNVGVGEHRNRL